MAHPLGHDDGHPLVPLLEPELDPPELLELLLEPLGVMQSLPTHIWPVPQIWQGLPPDWHASVAVPGWHWPFVSQQPLHVEAHEAPPPSSPLLPLLLLAESSPASSPGAVESSPEEPDPDEEVVTSSPLPPDEEPP